MNQYFQRGLILAAAIFLNACASVTPVDPGDTSRSVVFGYFDMDEAATSVDWIYLKSYDGTGGYTINAEDGIFYHVAVKPAPYQITHFGGSGFFAGNVVYTFPDTGRNETAIVIKQPGAYFAGSHRYVEVETGFLEADKFDIKTLSSPSEKTVLQNVLRRMRKDNPEYVHALKMVERRLSQL